MKISGAERIMMRVKLILITILIVCLSAFIFGACGHKHEYGEWETYKEATLTEEGEERRYCRECHEYESKIVEKLDAYYYITLVIGEQETKVGVTETGEYQIENPKLEGYEFIRWVDESGEEFSSSGTITESIKVIAELSILKTEDFASLKKRIEAGAREIYLGSNIEVTETLFVYKNLTIYTDENHTIKRAKDFLGDLFVVGENSSGDNPILQDKTVTMELKTEKDGSLVFDGNKINVTGEVKGSCFYVTNSSTLIMREGVTITNFKKTANERIVTDFGSIWESADAAGGSAVMITFGSFDMYGGLITENECSVDTVNTKSSYGGAIYNMSTMNMFGGKISNNKGARAGAIYCYRTSNIYKGDITGNSASAYGGAIYMPNSQYATLLIGDDDDSTVVNINGNHSGASGGAIFGQPLTNFVIYKGTIFEGNYTENSGNGGAINSSGAVLANGVTFKDNRSISKGGAVFVYYKDKDGKVRISEFNDCSFIQNKSKYGGALALESDDGVLDADIKQGAIAYVNGTTFTENSSTKNGGAIYTANYSELNINNSEFKLNTSTNEEYGGGAVYFTKSKGVFNGVTFSENSSLFNGGAVAIYSSSTIRAKDIIVNKNSAEKNGGGIYVNTSTFAIEGEEASEVTANTANGGGGIYATKASVDITSLTLNDNVATNNGGGLYVYENTVMSVGLLNASGNKAVDGKMYGGVIYLSSVAKLQLDKAIAKNNSAANGGFLYITSKGSEFILLEGDITGNTATETNGGNAIYSNAASAVIRFDGGLDSQKITFVASDITGKGSVIDIERGE